MSAVRGFCWFRRFVALLCVAAVLLANSALPAGSQEVGGDDAAEQAWLSSSAESYEGLTATDCDGDTPIVVASDEASRSDHYSAVTLAGVLGTDCVVLAGGRDQPMPANQLARLNSASSPGYIVGGIAAVPASKVAGYDLKRLAGTDRWHTARLVGAEAVIITAGNNAVDIGASAGAEDPDTDCGGDIPIVVASDKASQSDRYSAATLAGALGTDCIVLAGDRRDERAMPAGQLARLQSATKPGFIIGGTAAVSLYKVYKTYDHDLIRISGKDRWHTARLVGAQAVRSAGGLPKPVLISTDTEEYITEENDLGRYVKEEIVGRYGDEYPWLVETWKHTNRKDFHYWPNSGIWSVHFGGLAPDGIMTVTQAHTMVWPDHYDSPAKHFHELAHVYTLSNLIVSNPEPIGVGHIYFSELAGGAKGCHSAELYADAASALEFGGTSSYWHGCSSTPTIRPTDEAVEVVRQAFSGQTPQWFYDTFQTPYGLDYEAIWGAVLRLYSSSPTSGLATVNQLRYSFGGYCSESEVGEFIKSRGKLDIGAQPWVDGGCG